ncbi:MAG TPA: FAD-binding oxidoreductase [Candidatus Saccharimonadales bacterium]|nr:FAD-binding oxidoreductase [Candidatus Saccharimonadales bacterium]
MLTLPDQENSLWLSAVDPVSYPQLKENLEIDIVIIGGGICGLSTAYLLKQAGKKVAVIEKDQIGAGTTGRTTGKVTSQHNLFYAELWQRINFATARAYGQANQAGLKLIEKIIKDEKIDCGWQSENNYVYTRRADKLRQLEKEARAASWLGLPASYETSVPLPFEVKGAVKFSGQAKMSAQKYILGLAKAVDGGGSYVFENTRARRIHDGRPCVVKTAHGKLISKDIVVATNVPTSPFLARFAYCALEYPTTSYIVAGKTKHRLAGMYISPDKGGYSILPVHEDGQDFILIGGENHIPGLGRSRKRWRKLAGFAEQNLAFGSISYRWKARDYLAYDGLPLVGQVYPWSKHLYVGTAFKKWGLTNASASAIILRDLILGHKNPWALTFNSLRSRPITSIPKAIFH